MRLPQPTEYNEAVQDPRLCFEDEELRGGQVALTPLGLPRAHSGNFADVYQVTSADGAHSWAVKCFTRSVEGLHERYQAISEHLGQAGLPFLVEFHYLDRGIRVRGEWFPALKMRWVEGYTLNEFVRRQREHPHLLGRLAAMWVRLARQLRQAQVAHADLQHGNVLLVAGRQADRLRLRLIDYDGMCVPALADWPSGEVGHPNYQHPQRLREGTYHAEVDRFSHLVIYTALRALAAGLPLWDRYDNGENLLFREQDFTDPGSSGLLRELWEGPDPAVRLLAGHLTFAARGRLEAVPTLEDLLADTEPQPLTEAQERELTALLRGQPRRAGRATDVAPEGQGAWWVPGAVTGPAGAEHHEELAAAELLAHSEERPKVEPLPEALPRAPAVSAEPGAPGQVRARQVRVFSRPAPGRAEGEFYSAAAGLLARGRFALADAVPASLHAALWATLLAEDFVEGRRVQPVAWSAWLPPLQLSWTTAATEEGGEPLPPDPSAEALASFLGLVLYPARWLEGRRWEAVAVGDCCLFHIRHGLLSAAFPHERLTDLDAAEARIGSRTSFEPVLRRLEARGAGDWSERDRFWLMTRPLARWFLRQVEAWERPWEMLEPLLDRRGPGVFAEWVEGQRRAGGLGDGDLTLVAVCP
jgi:hypothetical protein